MRRKVVAYMNMMFFGGLFVGYLAASLWFPPQLGVNTRLGTHDFFPYLSWPLMILAIFLSNLVLSAFLLVTLLGFVIFPASACVLTYRALIWGVLVAPLSKFAFLATLPVVILEGEAYVLASVAGTVVGLSWIRLRWLYGSEAFSRSVAFKHAIKECGRIYVFIILLLIVAAAVETATLFL